MILFIQGVLINPEQEELMMPKGRFSDKIRVSREKGIDKNDVCKICGEPAIKRCNTVIISDILCSSDERCGALLCGRESCYREHERISVLHMI